MSLNYTGGERDNHQGYLEDDNTVPSLEDNNSMMIIIAIFIGCTIYVISSLLIYIKILDYLKIESTKATMFPYLLIAYVFPIITTIICLVIKDRKNLFAKNGKK